jgi:putative ABC transport system permease protein
MSGWRSALRMARREARRAKGRSALVILLIMLPIAAAAFIAASYDTFELTSEERAERLMGTAQAAISWPFEEPAQQVPDLLRPFPTGTTPPRQKTTEPTDDQLLALLPPGSRVIKDRSGALSMHTATGTGTIRTRLLDLSDPLTHGMFRQLSGRIPVADDEVALTPDAVGRLGAGVGGTVSAADGSRTFRVVGTVEDPENLAATTILLRPQAAQPSTDPANLTWLASIPNPLTWNQVKELNKHGAIAVSRHVLAKPPSEAEQYQLGLRSDSDLSVIAATTFVAGLVMLEIVLLAGPAFAVGARRRQRELALVAATGATPQQVRRIVLADGVVLGAVAAISGAAVGIAAAVGTRPLIEDFLTRRGGAFRVFPLAQAILVGLAVVTGVLAALVPAWISSRQDVVTALAGRRGITRTRRRWPILGLVLMAAAPLVAVLGAVQANSAIALAGLIGFELGLVMLTPSLVGLVARVGRFLPVAPRIALRDASRNRTAAAPAISAVMAVVVGCMAIAVVVGAVYRQSENLFTGRPGDVMVYQTGAGGPNTLAPATLEVPAETESTIRSVLPVEQVARVDLISCNRADCILRPKIPAELDCPYSYDRLNGCIPTADEQSAARRDSRCDRIGRDFSYFGVYRTTFGMSVVIEPDAAGVVANIPAEDASKAAEALRAGQVVVDEPRFLENGRVTLSIDLLGTDSRQSRSVTAPGFALPHPAKAPYVLMTRATAQSLGFDFHPFVTLATTSRMPTVAEQDRLQSALGSDFTVEVASATNAVNLQLVILAIVAGIIALVASALATGLAAADGRADLGTLAAIGASPRLRRMLSLSQSAVIAGLGSVLGSAAGVGAASLMLFALNQVMASGWPSPEELPITVPWLNLAIAVIVVPAAAMLGAGLLTRSRLPIERRL